VRQLRPKVNDELTLDAGIWEQIGTGDDTVRKIIPPDKSLYRQVESYLRKHLDEYDTTTPTAEDEAKAAVAVCLRWGSYLSVLADDGLPEFRGEIPPDISLIDDLEMARINTEASAALAEWLRMKREMPLVYSMYVHAAQKLPLPFTGKVEAKWDHYSYLKLLTSPHVSDQWSELLASEKCPEKTRKRAEEVEAHPFRILANTLVNICWRRTPNGLETLHEGYEGDYPLTTRRLTKREVRVITQSTARNFTSAFMILNEELMREDDERPWSERVLPFTVESFGRPRKWTLTEETRHVTLYCAEPPSPPSKGRVRASQI
jgi:hypothetical protein